MFSRLTIKLFVAFSLVFSPSFIYSNTCIDVNQRVDIINGFPIVYSSATINDTMSITFVEGTGGLPNVRCTLNGYKFAPRLYQVGENANLNAINFNGVFTFNLGTAPNSFVILVSSIDNSKAGWIRCSKISSSSLFLHEFTLINRTNPQNVDLLSCPISLTAKYEGRDINSDDISLSGEAIVSIDRCFFYLKNVNDEILYTKRNLRVLDSSRYHFIDSISKGTFNFRLRAGMKDVRGDSLQLHQTYQVLFPLRPTQLDTTIFEIKRIICSNEITFFNPITAQISEFHFIDSLDNNDASDLVLHLELSSLNQGGLKNIKLLFIPDQFNFDLGKQSIDNLPADNFHSFDLSNLSGNVNNITYHQQLPPNLKAVNGSPIQSAKKYSVALFLTPDSIYADSSSVYNFQPYVYPSIPNRIYAGQTVGDSIYFQLDSTAFSQFTFGACHNFKEQIYCIDVNNDSITDYYAEREVYGSGVDGVFHYHRIWSSPNSGNQLLRRPLTNFEMFNAPNEVWDTMMIELYFRNYNQTQTISHFSSDPYYHVGLRTIVGNDTLLGYLKIKDSTIIYSYASEILGDTSSMQIDTSTSIYEFNKPRTALFPNPVNETLFIESSNLIKEIQLIDAIGKVVQHGYYGIPTKKITLELDLPNGVYITKIVYTNGFTDNRIIIAN